MEMVAGLGVELEVHLGMQGRLGKKGWTRVGCVG